MVISMWASMATWFTPIILFCFLNLMIGSIFIASKFKIQDKQHQLGEHNSPQLARAPSINLSLYKFDHQRPFQSETDQFTDPVQDDHQTEGENENHGPEQHQLGEHNSLQLALAPSPLARVKSINLSHNYPSPSEAQFTDPVQDYHHQNEIENHGPELNRHVIRSKSDTCEEATPERVPAKMRKSAKLRKSASEKLAVGLRVEEKEEVELRRPATVRERKSKESETVEEEGGVDAKADDFINMFKQQLKLQRRDSLLRYKEMLSRGSAT